MRNLNDPGNWLAWLKACAKDPGSPIDLPKPDYPSRRPLAIFGVLTGQDRRALHAVACCWSLYAGGDIDGRDAALTSIRLLLTAMQRQCHPFARELIAQAMDWNDRARLWPRVSGADGFRSIDGRTRRSSDSLAEALEGVATALAAMPQCAGEWSHAETCDRCGVHQNEHKPPRPRCEGDWRGDPEWCALCMYHRDNPVHAQPRAMIGGATLSRAAQR